MPGQSGYARSNDINANGPIIAVPGLTLPGTLVLSTYQTYGNPSVLNCIGTGTWSVSTVALPTAGANHAIGTEVYVPVNGQAFIIVNGSGVLNSTLYTTRYTEV